MPTSAQLHSRSHALLLLQKLLKTRDNASPLTLILDSLEQSAKPVVREFVARAKVSKSKVIFVSFTTVKKPANIDLFIKARGKSAEALSSEIVSHYPTGTPGHSHKVLLVIDSLNPLSSTAPSQLAQFLGSIITPAVSLLGVYHTDVPLVVPNEFSEYEPHPLTVLSHLATAILRVSSLYQAIEQRRAQNRSLQEPGWGLKEGREGVLIGLRPKEKNGAGDGLVLEMELRRRSGRSVSEKFVVIPGAERTASLDLAKIRLLSDHPAFKDPSNASYEGEREPEGQEPESTFSLGLTEKQRRDREGVVLPYFDAQTDIGAGEGGRILYEMGREDDFDDEEDEI